MDQMSEKLLQTIDKYWEVFPSVWHTVRAHIRHEATENFDITVSQFHILRRIRRGIDSVSHLADDRHTSRPAISRGVDALVNKGLVSRTTDTGDRRYIRLALTNGGKTLLDELFGNTRQWMAARLSILTDDELESIVESGEALKKAFME